MTSQNLKRADSGGQYRRSPGHVVWPLSIALVIAAGLALHAPRLRAYTLYKDDWSFVLKSRTLEKWRAHVWDFHAQHCLPVFRTVTAILCWLSPRLSELPDVLRWGPVIAFVLVNLSLAQLAYQLTGSRTAALVAAGWFSISSVHASVLRWYSASVATWSAAFLILATTLWLRFVCRGGLLLASGATVCSVLALGFWSIGILVFPILLVILGSTWCLWAERRSRVRLRVALALTFTVCAGWYAWLVVLRAGEPVLTDFEGRPFLLAFRVDLAVFYTFRAIAERLALGQLAVWDPRLPPVAGFVYGAGIVAGVLWLWRVRRLSAPAVFGGLAMILFGFGFPYAFRAYVGYEQLRPFDWYVCLPQCGAGLLAAAVTESFLRIRPARVATPRTVDAVLLALAALAWFSHRWVIDGLPRALDFPRQRAQLAELELLEKLAWRHGIAEASLRRVIPRYRLDGAPRTDGLKLIDLPQTGAHWPPDELRALVRRALEYGTTDPAAPD